MTGFSNVYVRRIRKSKPNIAFIQGLWRVSKLDLKSVKREFQPRWDAAHKFVNLKNEKILNRLWGEPLCKPNSKV